MSRGGSTHVVLRAAKRCEPVYKKIAATIKESPWTVLDETGWHVGGKNAWPSRPTPPCVARCHLSSQDQRGQRNLRAALVEPQGRPVDLPPASRSRCHQLAWRVGDALRRHPPQSL